MEAFKNLVKQLEIQQAKQRQREAEEATKQNELRKAQADLSLDEAIALYGTQLEASTEAADSAQKGRAIKSRGIALCHKDQGYSANGRPVSLLTKSADLPAGHRRVIINKAAGRTLKAINLEGAE
ncbi:MULTISPECIES: hypothetical protein [Enterobacter cloacae complex]|uniref:hypothetical protein n=1 Tax=Enterobacter cloacae complex TaxID=354276 RepID=UPI00097BD494|nr:hypothetical protein [Enterobacter chengduensis]GJL40638.1 hypothetical protein TUM17577_18470 [Enterobacter asburiae]MBT1932373.1 hypothetical protein [Enterobacter chengduensis]MBT1961013.1 hypothetical protein [Enterobacter chengduensis]MCK7170591.1 hypothetical protein [Enterobacter chengduensis]MCM7673313.1 hypothetical protein [Enterobacter chengduensis]